MAKKEWTPEMKEQFEKHQPSNPKWGHDPMSFYMMVLSAAGIVKRELEKEEEV